MVLLGVSQMKPGQYSSHPMNYGDEGGGEPEMGIALIPLLQIDKKS